MDSNYKAISYEWLIEKLELLSDTLSCIKSNDYEYELDCCDEIVKDILYEISH